ncbi:MAG: short subunit dehydrogenase-like uncharacterized protein [Halioglobus sp.]|jgi:short subunit dehydrogenase-like uncharacterized protein
MSNRTYDVVVWGATGFTGQLVVQYLADTYGVGDTLNWAIAGRNQSKLEEVRKKALPDSLRGRVDIIIADSEDDASLAALASQTKVLCSTVGPYAKYGTSVVAACVDAGTDYCDLTGEVQWMARIIEAYQSKAEASGARIVHTCGFDSIPFDMGNWFVQESMHEKHGVYANEVKTRVAGFSGGASGGTIASMLNMVDELKSDPSLRKLMADPYSLNPTGTPPGNDGADQTGAVFDPDFDQWTAPFIMAAVNTRVVRRSNALLGHLWGQGFRYGEAVLSPSRFKAIQVGLASGAGMVAMALGPTRKLAERYLPKPGEGPSKEKREAGFFELFMLGIDAEDRSHDTLVKITGDMDPGYGSTSKMLGESAVCLALDERTTGGGIWTPASALKGVLLERLIAKAGLTFDVVDSTKA